MSDTYDVQPEGVTGIAEAIAGQGEELASYLEQSDFEGLMDGASGLGDDGVFVNGFQALVQQEVAKLIQDQVPRLEGISNTIKSSVTAVTVNATVYVGADDATRQEVLNQAGQSAATGDMTFFQNVIDQHNQDQEAAEAAAAAAAAEPPPQQAPALPPTYWHNPTPVYVAGPAAHDTPVTPPSGISSPAEQMQVAAYVVTEDGAHVPLADFIASHYSDDAVVSAPTHAQSGAEPLPQGVEPVLADESAATGPVGEADGEPLAGDGIHLDETDQQAEGSVVADAVPPGDTPTDTTSAVGPSEAPPTDGAPGATGESEGVGLPLEVDDSPEPESTAIAENDGSVLPGPEEVIVDDGDRVPLTSPESDAIARHVGALLRGRLA